jgi:hypothetical protein
MSRIAAKASQGEGDLERAARHLLQHLADASGVLCRDGGGFVLLDGPTLQAETDRCGPGLSVPGTVVQHCLKQDWLERRGQDLVVSEAGRAWLRRLEGSGDVFREQHQLRTTTDMEINGTRHQVLVNEAESPLGWLKSRKDRNGRPLLTEHQYQAGERLRADYWFARMSPRVTASCSALVPRDRSRRSAPSDPAAFSDNVIAAKERLVRALRAVGPELAGVLVDVCCELRGLEEAEKAQGWPQRAGKVVLQIALTRLARHYGLICAAEGAERPGRRLRHWGSEDYRPTLDAWSADQ